MFQHRKPHQDTTSCSLSASDTGYSTWLIAMAVTGLTWDFTPSFCWGRHASNIHLASYMACTITPDVLLFQGRKQLFHLVDSTKFGGEGANFMGKDMCCTWENMPDGIYKSLPTKESRRARKIQFYSILKNSKSGVLGCVVFFQNQVNWKNWLC